MLRGKEAEQKDVDEQRRTKRGRCTTDVNRLGDHPVSDEADCIEEAGEKHQVSDDSVKECCDPAH